MKKSGIIYVFLAPKESTLNPRQLDKLADILIIVGQLAAASMVLPFVIPGLDRSRLLVIVFGLVTTVTAWTTSLILLRRLK